MGQQYQQAWKFTWLLFVISGARGLRCYQQQWNAFGIEIPPANISFINCPDDEEVACIEAVSSINVGTMSATVLYRDCWKGNSLALAQDNPNSNQPGYNQVRVCKTDLCNNSGFKKQTQAFKTKVPNGIECYACIGPSNEDCSVDNAEKVKCYDEGSQCLNGTRTVQLGKYFIAMHVRTCERPPPMCDSLSILQDSDTVQIDQTGTCCTKSYCNRASRKSCFLFWIPALLILVTPWL